MTTNDAKRTTMEVAALTLLYVAFLALRYFWIDHETPAEKDQKRLAAGIRLATLRQYDDALAYFDQAVQQYPKSAVAWGYRGKCQLACANYYSAIYDLTQAISLDNTLAHCYLDRGIAYYRLAQPADAFREFDKAVWYFRDEQPDAYRWRAIARIPLRQLPQAENDLRRAVALGDENAFYLLRQPPFTKSVFQQ